MSSSSSSPSSSSLRQVRPGMDPPPRNGTSWAFPYSEPYGIQLDLMTALFTAIEKGQVGVFESPTGTGKSLSLICATFTWLRMQMERVARGDDDDDDDDDDQEGESDELDWVKEQSKELKRRERMRFEDELKERIEAVKVKERQLREKALKEAKMAHGAFFAKAHRQDKKQKFSTSATNRKLAYADEESDDDDSFLPSDRPAEAGMKLNWNSNATADEDDNYSPAVRALMAQMSSDTTSGGKPGNEVDELPETTPKIIYACRTHSQLSQFVAELKKTPFGKDISDSDIASPSLVRVIPLGSRKQMCINEKVQQLGQKAGNEAMNEACRDLLSGSKRCEHLPSLDATGQAQVLEFRDRAMAQVRDIEDLVEMGREMNTCPYYAARSSARQAHLITLPYNLLLQKNARESLGISLKDSVIVIDEAHNLIDTILGVYTISITSSQINTAKLQINKYLRRFGSRLRGQSEVQLRMLRKLLEGLQRACTNWSATVNRKTTSEEVWTASKMVAEMGGNLDTIDLASLERFLKDAQIARKVSGYAEKKAKQTKEKEIEQGKGAGTLPPSAIAAMHSIEAFIVSLSNSSKDGRVILSLASEEGVVQLKYQLLNPAESFTDLAEQARSIILAGGTMEPLADLKAQLMPTLPSDRLTHFSCGHIVPFANLYCSVIPSGPRGSQFDFTFDKRGDSKILDDLGNALSNFTALIPHGIVVFLPSYKFLDDVVNHWKANGTWTRLSSRKKIFLEPRKTSEVDQVLQSYSLAIHQDSSSGALLLAVVGAKLSEGINFSDRLARAVIMVGMPYPNSKSVELTERMKHLGPVAGKELYTTICMKAVNQSIGRAIRHQNDFAALLLVDYRYARKEIVNRLPGWIKDHVHVQGNGFGTVMKELGAFFRDKRSKKFRDGI
ncbi:unnamed protein product [Sympodiomycopsis kandeliae]